MTAKEAESVFDCPNCGARYKLVRVEAEMTGADTPVACRCCGAPLEGRDGRHILKYFLVDRPKHTDRPKLVDPKAVDPRVVDARVVDPRVMDPRLVNAPRADRSSPARSGGDASRQETRRQRFGQAPTGLGWDLG
jgi:hypothetical protein